MVSAPESARKERILTELKAIVNKLTGIDPAEMNVHLTFLDAGIDSLVLIQATQAMEESFRVRLSVVQLLEELNTLDAVADYLEQAMPPEAAPSVAPPAPVAAAVAPPTPVSAPPPTAQAAAPAARTLELVSPLPPTPAQPPQPPPVVPAPPAPRAQPIVRAAPAAPNGGHVANNGHAEPAAPASALEQIMAQQLQVMAQQLDMLRGGYAADPAPAPVGTEQGADVAQSVAPSQTAPPSAAPTTAQAGQTTQAAPTKAPAATRQIEPELFIPYQPIQKGATGGLTPRQQQHLDEFIRRYNARTRESKRITQETRPYVADSRVSAGFRLMWKELVYQLVSQRSAGSRLWDVDGNEYVDITMGFGLHLFGHSPDFIIEAIERQLKLGIELGPQSPLAGEVAKLICELTGSERVNFCNSGTEAVMGALRIARTVTRRNKIAVFAGAYHGWSDATLARAINQDGVQRSVPMAPGVPPLAVAETLVLNWNDPKSLDVLRAHAHELAAVLVEPVQSRRPDIQPREFLHELRHVTEETGVILIIDEMVTGFRVLPGGAQAWFGVQADLSIYGKVLGGGLPMGIVAGKARYMDAFDGGMWQYGDDSYPRAEKTIFAGAYFKHPLTMSVMHAILTRLKERGQAELTALNERTTRLAERLDEYFAQEQAPVRAVSYGSLFRMLFSREFKYTDLFYYHLVDNGVFIWEGRNCFLSTAHTDEDVEFIFAAIKKSLNQLRAGGFLPEVPPDGPGGGKRPDEQSKSNEAAPAASAAQEQPSAASGPARPYYAETPRDPQTSATTTPTTAPAATDSSPPGAGAGAQQIYEPARATERGVEPSAAAGTGLQFSLYYFGNYPTEYHTRKYDLVIKGVKYADEHDFAAVWLPERHFNSYGGFSPNPSIVAAALARETKRIHLRAGSVVLPLHHPIRVAEEWAMIDNLSGGRVGISFASGWHPNDFVFAPDAYEARRQVMDDGIEMVRKLWRGETVPVRNGRGEQISVGLSPMPSQPELPFWLTGGTHGTGAKAGRLGAGFLTNLQDQTIDELAEKIEVYHKSLAEHGHDRAQARVTVLMHTYVVEDLGKALADSTQPFRDYLHAAMGLRSTRNRNEGPRIDLSKVSAADLEFFLSAGFERYKRVGTLIGTPDSCAEIVDKLIRIGVTEVGCLIDFGIPTGDVMASLEHLNTLRTRYLPAASATRTTETTPIHVAASTPAPADGYVVPLTDTQKQFWVLTQLGEQISRQYNESVTLTLRGPLNVAALSAALQAMVARHDALRSTFSPEGDYQQVHPTMALDVPFVDFSAHAADTRAAQVNAWAEGEMRRPFDMARGPLLRAAIAKLDDEEHQLVFTTHHLVADGQSWGVLLNDLRELYAALSQGLPCQLPPPLPLRQQAQQQTSAQPDDAKAEAYWLAQFADKFPIMELPADRPRPRVPTYERAQVYRVIDAETGRQLKALSKQERGTLFITLLAGYSLLLHQLTGQDDLVVGINTADPTSVRRKDAVGYRINPQVVRSRTTADPTFKEHLAAIKRAVYGAYEHQHYSATKLFKKLNIARDARRFSAVAAGLNLDHSSTTVPGFHQLEVEIKANSTSAPSLDVYLDITELQDALHLKCNYNTDIFTPQTVARWLAHFEELLRTIVNDPAAHLSALPQFPQPPAPAADVALAPTLEPRSNLTKYQLLLWAGQKLNPDEAIFVNLGLFLIAKEIVPAEMQRAFQAIIDASDTLRTVIDEVDGVPQQRVLPALAYELEFLDFSTAADPRARLDEWTRTRSRRPLDLTKRAFDSTLVKLAHAEFAWYVNIHHAVADAWSLILVGQLGLEYYEAAVAGRLHEQAALPAFADYLRAEQEVRATPRYREAESYWKEKLAEPLAPLAFYGRTPVKRTTNVERITRRLGVERTAQLRAIATEADVFMVSPDATMSNILAALVAFFLARIAGTRRIALGVPFHNRRTKEQQQTIGLFMRILPLRITVEDDDTFVTLARKVGAEFFTALRYHEYAVGNPVHQPAYEVEFNYINATLHTPDTAPVQLQWPHTGHANESLAVQIHDIDQAGSLALNFDFHCDVFRPEQRAQALAHFLEVVDAFIADRTRPLRTVDILPAAERERLLVEFNQTATEFPADKSFAQLFEAQVAATPERTAVAAGARTLTYAELNAQANRLARHLRALGVGRNVVVPLLLKRSPEFLTAMLAVFKAGGAYLPLDPLYPPQRLTQLLGQCQSPLVLTAAELQGDLMERLAGMAWEERPQVLTIEELLAQEAATDNLPDHAAPDDLAYVIFTSGSTGIPKGAMLEQRGMINHLYAKVFDLKLTAADIIAQTASQSFDISVWQFLAALVVGGQVRIVDDETARDTTQLLALLAAQSVTICETVPSLLRALLDTAAADEATRPPLTALRWLLVTGEALPPDLCARWLAVYPHVPLLNAYGPTECSDDVTHHVIAAPPAPDSPVPIGHAIANTRLYVLDHRLALVPQGVAGELCVGGVGVGRGYLNDAARTAAVFIPDPFSPTPGARLYRTGDLVRHLPDGALEFLGRIDNQVKVRGYRIELGEIEAALAQHPAVRQAVVTAREDTPGDKRLVAYIVADGPNAPALDEWRAFLKERLPEYMTPSAFVLLDALPLTPNGKTDVKALPAPDLTRPDLQVAYVAPRTAAEEILAGIFCQVLNLEQVGVHDNFFELGGDSILSIQIVSRANQAGLRLTPMMLFQHQTIAELGAVAYAADAAVAEQGAVTGELPLTPIQHWFFERELQNPHHYNQALLLETRAPLDAELLAESVRHLTVQHDALRLRFTRAGDAWQQHALPAEEKITVARFDLSALPAAEQRAALEAEAARLQASLHLSDGPLMRVALFDLGAEQTGRLLFVIHHLAVDGVSWRILLEDLQTVYQQLASGAQVQLPPKTTSYKQWSERLVEYAAAPELQPELDYWLAAGRAQVKPLPRDHAQGENTMASGRTVALALSAAETQALLKETPATLHAQINELLLTALARTCARWSGAQALLVNLESHGREELFAGFDLTRTVGWFTTIAPLLLEVGGAGAPVAELAAVQEQLRRVPQRGVGYGVLRYLSADAQVRARFAALPPAEVSFNYLGQLDQSLPESGLLKLAAESSGPTHEPQGQRSHVFDVNTLVVDGQFQLKWSYSEQLHERATVEALAQDFLTELRAFIAGAPVEAAEINLDELAAFNWTEADVADITAALGRLEQ
jgi:natural product biosynthesis luciferase-like monooxygenase protein/amino acid adenylation domain-containing protein/non-ribosomal peptide synthase protein (TIGR01720 family)